MTERVQELLRPQEPQGLNPMAPEFVPQLVWDSSAEASFDAWSTSSPVPGPLSARGRVHTNGLIVQPGSQLGAGGTLGATPTTRAAANGAMLVSRPTTSCTTPNGPLAPYMQN